MKREGAVLLGSRKLDVLGTELEVGQAAPDFELTANDWRIVHLADYAGKIKLISVVPSLDTRVCDMQTRRFNQEAAELGDRVAVLTVSADLPYAQRRWCGNAGIDRVQTLSDHKKMSFGNAYGTHIADLRLDQRSVFVIDADDTLVYCEYVPEFGQHPNYEAALAVVKTFLSNEK